MIDNDENRPVSGLKTAMLERARTLAAEHVSQGNQSRQKILQDTREKIQLMEQKELLLAKSLSEREYLRSLQASEIQMQAALDRNRWELVQAVLQQIEQHLKQLPHDSDDYRTTFLTLFREAASLIDDDELVATINASDRERYGDDWDTLCQEVTDKQVVLSEQTLSGSGGIKLSSSNGELMVDNSFEGLLAREREPLQKTIFERLFATVNGAGALHG